MDYDSDSDITWTRRKRPAARWRGHDVRRYGRRGGSLYGPRLRTFVECECGVVLSGNGQDGGLYSYYKHARRQGVAR